MLQVMRDMSKSWIFKGLMLLLIVSFGIWGIGDMFRGNPQQRTVAEVGKVGISVMELESNFRATLPEARRVFGPELTDQQAREKGVLDRTLYILIEHATFNQEAKRLGLDVSDKVILSKVAANPKFRDRDGKFDMQLWRRALGKTGISERYFMDEERHQEARGLIFNALKNDLKTPQTLVDYLYRARGAKRILEVLTLAHANMNGVPAPDEAALKTFHEDHGDLFAAPETRAMTIAKLASDDAIKGLELSEEDLKNAYDSRSAELTRPEQRDLTQAVVSDEDKAKAIAEAAKTGTPLSVAAKAKGASAVDLKGVDEKSILPELYTSVFAMEEGQIEGPLKSPLGWHVVQLRKVHPSGKPSFDEVKKELRESLQKERAADAVARAVNQLDDALAAGKALEDIADGLSLRLIKIPALEANGKTPDGKDPGELPAKNDVLKVAFNQGAGETSSIIDDKNGNYVVVRTDDVVPTHVLPFEKVKDQVATAWKKEKQAEKAAAEVDEMAKAVRDGKKMTAFANQPGVEVRLSKPISLLGDMDRDVPVSVLPQILQMKSGDVITAALPDRHFVLRLADVVPVDPTKPGPGRLKIEDSLKENLPNEIPEEYARFLHERFPIKINQNVLDFMKKQGS